PRSSSGAGGTAACARARSWPPLLATPTLSPFESIGRRASSTPTLSPFESIAPPEDGEHRRDGAEDGDAAEAHEAEDVRSVFPTGRVVPVTGHEDAIDDRADFPLACLEQAEPQVSRRELRPIEVARDASVRREHHDCGGVRVEIRARVV